MTWKFLLAAAVLALGACKGESGEAAPRHAEATAPGYTLDVFGLDAEQIYLVAHESGRVAAARVLDGRSTLIAADEARRLLAERQAQFTSPQHQVMNVRAGDFSLSINADDDKSGNGAAHIEINGGDGGISIDAQDGEGEGGDRARVHITGASEETARKFVNDADGLSAEVKAGMLRELGL
ncbi:MAG TPA: hypothetical protein VG841_01145 [Caulobacterales bacterium]|nr:hypothetical protein [Caulobacterales bacterium]